MYRIKYVTKLSPGASTTDLKYYESSSIARMEADLLRAHLDMASSSAPEPERTLARLWRQFIRGNDDTYPRIERVFRLEVLKGGEWWPVPVEYVAPRVVLGAEGGAL